LRLQDEKLLGLEPLLQASELRQLMKKVRPFLQSAGFDRELSDDRQYLGESCLFGKRAEGKVVVQRRASGQPASRFPGRSLAAYWPVLISRTGIASP
jgi:hypothetical protein